MDLTKDWKEFIELLNSHKVEYVVIGAFAVALHGHRRLTGDIDFFVRRSSENARRVLGVLRDFGFGSLNITEQDFLKEDWVIQLGHEPGRIDLTTGISGVDFDSAWERRIEVDLEGTPVPYLSLDLLIQNKLATGRPEDERDVIKLKRVHRLS